MAVGHHPRDGQPDSTLEEVSDILRPITASVRAARSWVVDLVFNLK